jgi:ABC-type sugar transport system permease subunit
LIYDPNLGSLNKLLRGIGLDDLATNWLSDPRTAMPAIIVVSLWGAVGMNMLIFFAGLQSVGPTYYEAAMVDGAGPLQQFRHITIPGLRVVTAIVLSLNLMNGFKVFDIIFVMTGGGPNHASEVFGTYLYSLAFGSTAGSIPQLGYGSAFSVVVMALCGIAVAVQVTLSRRAAR